jgi:hypothetical protein
MRLLNLSPVGPLADVLRPYAGCAVGVLNTEKQVVVCVAQSLHARRPHELVILQPSATGSVTVRACVPTAPYTQQRYLRFCDGHMQYVTPLAAAPADDIAALADEDAWHMPASPPPPPRER